MSEFEVVRSDVDGWDVRRGGRRRPSPTTRPGSWPRRPPGASRRPRTAGGDAGDDVRQVFSEGPEEDLDREEDRFLGAGA